MNTAFSARVYEQVSKSVIHLKSYYYFGLVLLAVKCIVCIFLPLGFLSIEPIKPTDAIWGVCVIVWDHGGCRLRYQTTWWSIKIHPMWLRRKRSQIKWRFKVCFTWSLAAKADFPPHPLMFPWKFEWQAAKCSTTLEKNCRFLWVCTQYVLHPAVQHETASPRWAAHWSRGGRRKQESHNLSLFFLRKPLDVKADRGASDPY